MALTKKSKIYASIEAASEEAALGCIMSIDPSAGSSGSMPAWAIHIKGNLIDSGIIYLPLETALHYRLRILRERLEELHRDWNPHVLVYEEIPPQRYGGDASRHATLIKAVGVCMSVGNPHSVVGFPPMSWKKLVRPGYTKSDINDAVEMGWIVHNEALKILNQGK